MNGLTLSDKMILIGFSNFWDMVSQIQMSGVRFKQACLVAKFGMQVYSTNWQLGEEKKLQFCKTTKGLSAYTVLLSTL